MLNVVRDDIKQEPCLQTLPSKTFGIKITTSGLHAQLAITTNVFYEYRC